jgi:hypothetical protein
MVVVRPDGTVGRVETISFDEPPDYLPRGAWYRQFDGRALDPELELRRAIRPVTGATLTARATTDAVRSVLAYRVLKRPLRSERRRAHTVAAGTSLHGEPAGRRHGRLRAHAFC